ncbi:hypothetical protein BOX15_Mlig020474g1 [Macrostomum lignano]|uniref:Uncharacterized protein n=1 Tax=Macrostomum lignano TaxID=282301 RepID=A0A267GEJ8_9PLAT|nr:hypothetical protein BOX15_Mlig020474g1 [Macrostomum lignano]
MHRHQLYDSGGSGSLSRGSGDVQRLYYPPHSQSGSLMQQNLQQQPDSARSSVSTAGSTAPLTNPRRGRLPTPPPPPPPQEIPSSTAIEEAVEQAVSAYARHTLQQQYPNQQLNVVEALQDFWRDRYPPESGVGVTYESQAGYEPPYVCFVQLPGGACFATCSGSCASKAEARRSAAKVALMNSIFNDHPARRITREFIDRAVAEASTSAGGGGGAMEAGVDAFRLMLESNMGRTMLEFQEMMTLLHWNGSLRAMRQRNCTRSEVIAHYRERRLDDDMRSQMALDWIARERDRPGLLRRELTDSQEQLLNARLQGKELRFYKEKCDILALALSQCDECQA